MIHFTGKGTIKRMAEIVLSGAPIDSDINKSGDLVVLTESKVFIVSLSRSKDSDFLSNICLPVNDLFPLYSKGELPFMVGKRVWWLPSTNKYDRVLLLTASLQWLIYRRIIGSLQWSQSNKFSPELDKYFKHLKGMKLNQFVDMVMIHPTSKAKHIEVKEFLRNSAVKQTLVKGQFLIDHDTMPQQYHLGLQVFQRRKQQKKRKKKIKIKKEVITPAHFVSEEELKKEKEEDEEVEKPVIKQLVKTASSGEKRLITYIMDGKQREDQVDNNDCEEKVQCVCGATEENSSEDEEWVECELCHTWLHVDCVAYFPEVQDYYHCDDCLKADAKKAAQSKNKLSKKGKRKGRPPNERINNSNIITSLPKLNGSFNEQLSEHRSDKINEVNIDKAPILASDPKKSLNKRSSQEITEKLDKDNVDKGPILASDLNKSQDKQTLKQRTEKVSKANKDTNPTPATDLSKSLDKQTSEQKSNKDTTRTDATMEGEFSSKDNSKHVEEVGSSDLDSDSSCGMIHHGNHINCPCGVESSESGEEWVQCDQCDKWQHQICVNYADEDKTHYQCPSCKEILTFFANKKFAPITADSLVAKKVAPSAAKEKFRIPKKSKDKDEGFKVVGSSSCNPSTFLSQVQPVYLPKSLDEADLIGILKSTIGQNKNRTQSSQGTFQSSTSRSVSGDQNMSSNNLSAKDNSKNNLTNGNNLSITELNSDEVKNGSQINSFALVLCTDRLIILRGSPKSPFQISSLYTFDDREMSMMSAFSNAENTQHHIAMVDYNSSNVLIWKLSYCDDDDADTYSNSVMSLPSLVLTAETVLTLRDDIIDRMMWLNQFQILIFQMGNVICYDVGTLQSIWVTVVNFDFVTEWFLQSDKKLVVFDNIGSNIVIDTDNGNVLHRNVTNQKDDLVVNSRISPSNLLKYEMRIPSNQLLQYSTPCKLFISRNELFTQTQTNDCLSTEQNFLKMSLQPPDQTKSLDIPQMSEGLSCTICDCANLTPSDHPFEVVCSKKHTLFVDPNSKVILEPFTAKECANCSVFNHETVVKCGSCKQTC